MEGTSIVPPNPPKPTDPATIMYTSGTTGKDIVSVIMDFQSGFPVVQSEQM